MVFTLTCLLSSGLILTCSFNSPISMISSHCELRKTQTKLLNSSSLGKTPSKTKLCLTHFSKWYYQAPSCLSQNENVTLDSCHPFSHPNASPSTALDPHPLSIFTPPLSSWSSSLTWKTAGLLVDLQLPGLPCCRASSAEHTGLLNENHILPRKTYRASFHAQNTIHRWALCELTLAPLSNLISLYCPSFSYFSHFCLFFFYFFTVDQITPISFLRLLSLFPLPWTVAGCFFSWRSRFRFELFQ